MYDLEQEYNNLNIQQPAVVLENTDQKVFLQIQKIQKDFAKFMEHSENSENEQILATLFETYSDTQDEFTGTSAGTSGGGERREGGGAAGSEGG